MAISACVYKYNNIINILLSLKIVFAIVIFQIVMRKIK
jgi:hypothetical protein